MLTPAGGAPPVLRKRSIALLRFCELMDHLTMNNICHLLLRIGTFDLRAPGWRRGHGRLCLQLQPAWPETFFSHEKA
jgi:hypothetical protein